MQSVRIDKGRIVPVIFCVIGTFGIFYLYQFFYDHLSENWFIIISLLVSPALPMLWTTRSILEINPFQQRVIRFVWMMGKKIRRRVSPSTYVELVLEKGTGHHELIGYLRMSNDEKVRLITDPDPKYVEDKMEEFARKLEVSLVRNYGADVNP